MLIAKYMSECLTSLIVIHGDKYHRLPSHFVAINNDRVIIIPMVFKMGLQCLAHAPPNTTL